MDPHATGNFPPQTPAPQYSTYEKGPQAQAFPQQTPPPGQFAQQPPPGQFSPGQGPPPMAHQGSYGMPQQGGMPQQQGMPHQQGMPMGQMPAMGQQHQGMMSPQPGPGQPPPMMQHNSSGFGQSNRQQFQNATPLQVLGRGASPVDCPSCAQRAMTRTNFEVGNTTHAWALGAFCFTLCLCFVPYMMNSTKDVTHHCGNCGTLLATWHRSGSTEVHQHH